MSKKKAIEIKNLVKKYKNNVQALKGISLNIEKGDFFALLGPNGAGKSTTIGIINTIVKKTSGEIWVSGLNHDTNQSQIKLKLGVVPQEFNFNIFEPCIQILINQAGYYGVKRKVAIKRAEVLLDKLGLYDKRKMPAGSLSGGLKRRLMIARSLMHEPEILILDEPTAGVDISLRRSMWDYLIDLNKTGVTIILTTHYLEEAESLCKNIAIIDKGEVIESGPTKTLLSKMHVENITLYCEACPEKVEGLDIKIKKIDHQSMNVQLSKDLSITSLVSSLKERGIVVNRIENKANRIEELFLRLVGDV